MYCTIELDLNLTNKIIRAYQSGLIARNVSYVHICVQFGSTTILVNAVCTQNT